MMAATPTMVKDAMPAASSIVWLRWTYISATSAAVLPSTFERSRCAIRSAPSPTAVKVSLKLHPFQQDLGTPLILSKRRQDRGNPGRPAASVGPQSSLYRALGTSVRD